MFSIALSAVLAIAPLDVPGCKVSKKEVGSLHAQTSFEVSMTPPKSKLKQPLDCGGKTATLYVSEFAKPALAQEAANFVGPQLWGGVMPTPEHTDELLQKGALLVVISGDGVRPATEALGTMGFTVWRGATNDVIVRETPSAMLERVAKAIDCAADSKDPLRAWCAAGMGANAGFKSAKNDTVLLGISAPLPANVEVREMLLRATRVSALAFSGGKVRLTDVTPDNLANGSRHRSQRQPVIPSEIRIEPRTVRPDCGALFPPTLTRSSS